MDLLEYFPPYLISEYNLWSHYLKRSSINIFKDAPPEIFLWIYMCMCAFYLQKMIYFPKFCHTACFSPFVVEGAIYHFLMIINVISQHSFQWLHHVLYYECTIIYPANLLLVLVCNQINCKGVKLSPSPYFLHLSPACAEGRAECWSQLLSSGSQTSANSDQEWEEALPRQSSS